MVRRSLCRRLELADPFPSLLELKLSLGDAVLGVTPRLFVLDRLGFCLLQQRADAV